MGRLRRQAKEAYQLQQGMHWHVYDALGWLKYLDHRPFGDAMAEIKRLRTCKARTHLAILALVMLALGAVSWSTFGP